MFKQVSHDITQISKKGNYAFYENCSNWLHKFPFLEIYITSHNKLLRASQVSYNIKLCMS